MPTPLLRKTPLMLFSRSLARIAVVQNITKDLEDHDVVKLNSKINFLYRSYIVYLTALWQTFLKTLAKNTFDLLVKSEPNSIFRESLRSNLEQTLSRFNSPDTQNIDRLFEAATGIKKISNHWHWEDMSTDAAKQKLDELLKIRHQIAHTAHSSTPLSYEGNFDYMNFLYKVASVMSEFLNKYVSETTGQSLFEQYVSKNE